MQTVTKVQRKRMRIAAVIALAVWFLASSAWASSPVTLAGTGAVVSFPSTNVGQSAEVTVTINVNAPITLAKLSVIGDFSVKNTTCDAPVTLASGDSCVLVVGFSPSTAGSRWSPLLITDDKGMKYTFGLVGNGVGPVLTFSPGLVSTVGGTGAAGYSGDGGPATSAQLNLPMGIARDSQGNLYIADLLNNVIRKVNADGTISTVAGNGTQGYSGDGGPATSAQLAFPWGVALDAAGNLYIADYFNFCIRKVDANGTISTLASGSLIGVLAADSIGNVYYSSSPEGVWKVDSQGLSTRIAGNGNPGFSGDGGPATDAQTSGVSGLALDDEGNLFLAEDFNSDVRKVDTNGIITTVAGDHQFGFSGDGGPATSARFNTPVGVRIDAARNLYIVDSSNNRIRKVNAEGTITTIAGDGNYGYAGDGDLASRAQFAGPFALSLDESGSLFIADRANNVIREVKVDSTTLDFGSVKVGQTGGPLTVIVSNAGNAELNVTDVVVSGSFGVQTTCIGNPLPPGAECSVDVSFTPTGTGNIIGTVSVTNDAAGSPHIISLKGEGYVAPKATDLVLTGQYSVLPLNSNLGVVAVNAMDANGHLVTDFSGGVTLQLQGPGGFTIYNGQANAVGGIATFDLTAVILNVAGSYTITVTSPGLNSMQALFEVAGNGDFAIATSKQSLKVSGNGSSTLNVTVTPSNGFSGTIALDCSGLPVYTTCSFAPGSLQANGSDTPLKSVLTISTGVANAATVQRSGGSMFLATGTGIFSTGLLGLAFAPRGRRSRRSQDRRARLVQWIVVLIVLCAGLIGCGTVTGHGRVTPPGTYKVTVTAASGAVSHSSNFTLVVE